MFDLLTYEKGCGVLRMLEQHIGADVFRDGMRTYLKAHAYGNTVTTDLWDALEDASGAPVRDVMNTFILQGGHPLVSLHGDTLSQQPFSFGPPPPGVESSIGDVWNVPIAVRALPAAGGTGAPVRHLVLGPDPTRMDEAHQGLAVLNAGGWGVFRVGYETEHRLALAEHLPELTPLERANLLSDTWATTLAGLNELREFMVLASQLGLEPDPAPWASVGSALVLANRIALARARGRGARRGGRAARPHLPQPRLRCRVRRGRPHALPARPGHQPHGHRRRRRRRPGRGGAALRCIADRRRLGPRDPRGH